MRRQITRTYPKTTRREGGTFLQTAARSEDAGVAKALRQGRATQPQEAKMTSLPTSGFGIGSNIGSAILAGGKNRRMKGKNKAFISIDGSPIIRRTIDTLKEIFEEIFIVTNSPRDYKLYDKEAIIITDIIKEAGPLGGIHSALSKTLKEGVFFVACDMPFLHNDIILSQINYFSKINCDCLVAKVGPSIEPLHGIYKKSLKNKIESFIKENGDYTIRNFLKKSDVGYFELEDNVFHRNAFRNLNTPEDLCNSS